MKEKSNDALMVNSVFLEVGIAGLEHTYLEQFMESSILQALMRDYYDTERNIIEHLVAILEDRA